jgi:valyl-tRNA synthetase
MSIAPKGQDIRFSEERIEQGRNFCNKLWNVSRFRLMSSNLSDNSLIELILARIQIEAVNEDDQAILLRLVETLNQVEKLYKEYEFNAVLQTIYRFFWNDFCDWYIEVSKLRIQNTETKDTCLAIQDICLRQILLLLHPFTPFITEELWTLLGFACGNSIQGIAPGTGTELLEKLNIGGLQLDSKVLEEMENIRDLVTSMRSLKADRNLSNNRNVAFSYVSDDDKAEVVSRHTNSILTTVGASAMNRAEHVPNGMPSLVTPFGSVYLDLSTGVDLEAEKARLQKDLERLEKIVHSVKAKLANQAFTSKAPPEIIEGARHQLLENETKLNETIEALSALKS